MAAALAVAAGLGACANGSDQAGSSTSSTTQAGSSTSTDTAGSTGSTTSSGSSSSTRPSTSTAATTLPTCTAGLMRTRAETQPGGGAAGSITVQVIVTNTSSKVCQTSGYPGVSLTAPETGKQLGAPADREPTEARATMRLEPGKSAVALVKVAQAGNFGSDCKPTRAAGFRIYLPGDKAAEYAPYAVEACANPSVHQLSVRPFNT